MSDVIGRAAFPTVGSDETVNLRRAVVSLNAQPGKRYRTIDLDCGRTFSVDECLNKNGDAILSWASALEAAKENIAQHPNVFLTVEENVSIDGASAGLALVIALLGHVVPHVAFTGYIQALGVGRDGTTQSEGSLAYPLMPIGQLQEKMKGMAKMQVPLVYPAQQLTTEKDALGRVRSVGCPTLQSAVAAIPLLARENAASTARFFFQGSRWMSQAVGLCPALASMPLQNWSFAGSHDSGTYNLSSDSPSACDADSAISEALNITRSLGIGVVGSITANFARTQEMRVLGQLRDGVRYIDIRVCKQGDRLFCCHALQGAPLEDVLSDAKKFCFDYPTEPFILHFQKVYGCTFKQVLDYYGGFQIPTVFFPDTQPTYSGCCGKVIVLQGDNGIENPWMNTSFCKQAKQRLQLAAAKWKVKEGVFYAVQSVCSPSGEDIKNAALSVSGAQDVQNALASVFAPSDVHHYPDSLEELQRQGQNTGMSWAQMGTEIVLERLIPRLHGGIVLLDFIRSYRRDKILVSYLLAIWNKECAKKTQQTLGTVTFPLALLGAALSIAAAV